MRRGVGILVGVTALLGGVPTASAATIGLAYGTGGSKGPPHIVIANANGSGARTIAVGDVPAVAPNGRSVAFVPPGGSSSLLIYSAAGALTGKFFSGKQVSAGYLSWSHDSRYLAVGLTDVNAVNKVGKSGLAVIDTKTGKVSMVAHGMVSGDSWAPNHDTIVFGLTKGASLIGPYNLYTSGPTVTALTQLTTNGRSANPLWGKLGITYDGITNRGKSKAPAYQLFLLKNGHSTQITHMSIPPLLDGLVPVAVSADGTRMIAGFVGEDTDNGYTVDLATHATHEIMVSGQTVTPWGISRNGQRLLIDFGGFMNSSGGKVESLPFGGGTPTVLATHGNFPSWNQ